MSSKSSRIPMSTAKPTTPRSVAQPITPRSVVQPTTPRSVAKPTTPRSVVQPTTPRSVAKPITPRSVVQPTISRSVKPPAIPLPRYTKPGYSVVRQVGSKAVSQGTVPPNNKSYLNDYFKSADPIRPSANSHVKKPETVEMMELPGSGEAAGIKKPNELATSKDGQKGSRSLIKKFCGIPRPDSRFPVKVLMSPKPASNVSPCISRSPFDQDLSALQVSESCNIDEIDDISVPPVDSTKASVFVEKLKQTLLIEEVPKQLEAEPMPVLTDNSDDTCAVNKATKALAPEESIVQSQNFSNIISLQLCESSYEGEESLEKVLPPYELHEVVSDPQWEAPKEESQEEMLQFIQPVSLVESLDEIPNSTCQVEDSHETKPVEVFEHGLYKDEISQGIAFDYIKMQDSIEKVNDCELKQIPQEMSESNKMGKYSEAISFCGLDVQENTSDETICINHQEIAELFDESYKEYISNEISSINHEEIAELFEEMYKETNNIPFCSTDLENETTKKQDIETVTGGFMKPSLKQNISRLEKKFLPFMMETGLRPEILQAICEENEPEELHDEIQILEEVDNKVPKSYRTAADPLDAKLSDDEFQSNILKSRHFEVAVPNTIILTTGAQPLTYHTRITIRNAESIGLTYKVQVQSTNRYRYVVKPATGYLPASGSAEIHIESYFTSYEELSDLANDKFIILIANAPSSNLSKGGLKEYWKLLRDSLPESFTIFKVEKVEIDDLTCSQPLLKKKKENVGDEFLASDMMTEDESEDLEPELVNQHSPSDLEKIEHEVFINVAKANDELLAIEKKIQSLASWGCIALYLGSVAVIGALVLKDVESIILPPEPEQSGWLAWMPFFGK